MKKIGLYCSLVVFLINCLTITAFAIGEGDTIVSTGSRSSYVIKNDGSLWGWG